MTKLECRVLLKFGFGTDRAAQEWTLDATADGDPLGAAAAKAGDSRAMWQKEERRADGLLHAAHHALAVPNMNMRHFGSSGVPYYVKL